MFSKAKQGDREAIAEVKQLYNAKVYTDEEIALLNNFFIIGRATSRGGSMDTSQENEIIDVRDKGAILVLPSLNGSEHPAIINWIQQMEGDYYLAGLTYVDHYPYRDGSTEWVLKLVRDKNCGTCIKGSEGVCYEAAGEDYGHATEVSDKTVCDNWEGVGFIPMFCSLHWKEVY